MAEQLAVFEVPRVSVDFLANDLSGAEKLTVLKCLALDSAISQIGRQRFSPTVRDNMPLKPIRVWVAENRASEFVYDLRERTVPITFRTGLALALLTTRLTEHLSQMGEVEVYASGEVQKVALKHTLGIESGLSRIDYAALSPEAKGDLVVPLIQNLRDAEAVARAGYLFPAGVSRQTASLLDPSLLFQMFEHGNLDEIITFGRIGELETQAAAARACLRDMQKAREFQAAGETVREQGAKKEYTEEEMQAVIEASRNREEEEFPDIHYEPGTSFSDVFPYQEGETAEDVRRAFQRMTGGGYFSGHVDEPHRGEYLKIHIAADGRLIGLHGADGSGSGLMGVFQTEIDMLSGRFEYDEMDRRYRRENVFDLLERIRDELDINKRAIAEAQTKYGQTSFTVELGFLLALTDRIHPQATEAQIDEDKILAREARKTAGEEGLDRDQDEESAQLVVLSDQPFDKKTVELDYLILAAIKRHFSKDPAQILPMMLGLQVRHTDNIGKWFSSCASLLSTFQGVLVDTPSLFATLGIKPTNDLSEIRHAYRAVASETHPDKTAVLTVEEQAKGSERFLQATSAYRNLQQRVGNINVNELAPTYYLGRISQLFAKDIQ